jgi:hypothetical protein
MVGVITEEQVISRSQYLDLVYSQTDTLYELILDTHCPSMNPTLAPPVDSHVSNGVIGTFHAETQSIHTSHTNPNSTTSNVQNIPTPTLDKTSEVNLVQSTPTGKNKIKIKGRVIIRRTKIIIYNLRSPKHILLMTKINVNLITLSLFVVTIIIREIVHDALRLLSSCKEPRSHLHLSSCHNCFLLNSRPNWSFMTNLLLLLRLMSL